MTDHATLYAQRLTTPAVAAALIPSGARVAMALGVAQPPALLKALADRAEANAVGDVNIYYLLSTAIAGETVLAYDKPQYDPQDGDAQKLIAGNGGQLLIGGGTISLQSESAPVDFRRVEIKVLKP